MKRPPRKPCRKGAFAQIDGDIYWAIRRRENTDLHLRREWKCAHGSNHESMRPERLHVFHHHADGEPDGAPQHVVEPHTEHNRLADAPCIGRLSGFRQSQRRTRSSVNQCVMTAISPWIKFMLKARR